ncbi:NADPH-dependent 2,4-dienoyl-CoA reductase/sulfur reductase-like enzyme [Microbacterium testaceum]|uniref:FAD/NAD(P)-binding protein n=1 Tax=Microbacterium testaceum TaxID=2033 RepID=UPI00278A771C|nr:FAD/NAD(P)-binding protein [Microbacterium testaceum]MDQ1172461.1 NADPH-dependent 2,4-dienoyl-CoA reductase/sulfur reductase-like enzyme [Microbacterium testaceum]
MTDVVIVGAGPRAVMLVERLLARRTRDARPPLRITLIDPFPPGGGRIWRREQSSLLKLNSMARDVTVFTDDSCVIAGPVRSGPLAHRVGRTRARRATARRLDRRPRPGRRGARAAR